MIVVFGANGTTGALVVESLLAKKLPVRAVVRDLHKAERWRGKAVEVMKAELGDRASVQRAVAGAEKIYLVTSPHPDLVALESNVVDAAKAAKVKLLVNLGGIRVEDDSVPFLIGKLHGRAQQAIRASGVPYVLLRPNFFAQNFLMSAPTIGAQGAIYAPTGAGRASFIDARDIARVVTTVLTEDGHAGRTYDLTGAEALSFADAARTIGEVLGRRVEHVDVPTAAFVEGGVAAGLDPWLVDRFRELYDHLRTTDWFEAPSPSVEAITGRAPISFVDFVRDHRGMFG